MVTAFVGPEINPTLAMLTGFGRARLLAVGVAFHLIARYLVTGMEDRS